MTNQSQSEQQLHRRCNLQGEWYQSTRKESNAKRKAVVSFWLCWKTLCKQSHYRKIG